MNRHFIIILVFLLVLIMSGLINQLKTGHKDKTLEKYRDQAINACVSSTYKPECYSKQILSLQNISMEDAFKITSLIMASDNSFTQCHVLSHKLGAKEVKKNPDKWMNIISRCPQEMCSNGCLHGTFQERFNEESATDEQFSKLENDFKDICKPRKDWHPSEIDQALCYHALGHLYMYLTKANINKSLDSCKNTLPNETSGKYLRWCLNGVFMMLFQQLEPEDVALVKNVTPKKEEFFNFCSKFIGIEKRACISQGWPLFETEIMIPKGLLNYCNLHPESEKRACLQAIEYFWAAQLNLDVSKMKSYCFSLPKENISDCLASMAMKTMMEMEKNPRINTVLALCGADEELNKSDWCFTKISKTTSFFYEKGSKDLTYFCKALPKRFQSECLSSTEYLFY